MFSHYKQTQKIDYPDLAIHDGRLISLKSVTGKLTIHIWGPIEDKEYWSESLTLIETLPGNVTIESKGPVSHDRVPDTLNDYHYFILPTLGENFGHVYIEALAAGCPVITSDQTPWRDLKRKGIGWDLSLDRPDEWIRAINECIDMDQDRYREHSSRARQYAVDWLSDPEVEASNREVLKVATQNHRRSV
jgi:glycosyltransferase involved in cell wall biosynthesis